MARKQKMKVYHGILKSVTDKYTLFYDSFDGTNTLLKDNSFSFISSPTGYGIKILNTKHMKQGIPLINTGIETHTLDCWFYSGTTSFDIFNFEDKSTSDQMINRSMTLYYVKNIGIQFTYFDKNSANQPKTIAVPKTINIGWTHLRLIVEGNVVSLYVNGKLHSETLTKIRPFGAVWLGAYPGFGGAEYKIPLMSDLHISNTNRGDHFPNLPQDFIDGKATIKPRMGQQQIKGDSMHSQITTIKVDTDPNNDMYKGGVDAGFQRHTYKPELSLTSSNFESGTSIRIKGLDGEIISGVIDGDTALCVITSSGVSAQQWSVDDVSKLKVGDAIVCVAPDFAHVSSVGTIAEINTDAKIIKLSSPLSGYEAVKGYYIFETTALTSSPVVATRNGATVAGTWNGLGTNQATFVLGNNSSLKGQDLYIEYSLTMPYGNSDFPEIPHTIEKAWAENGVEMRPVNEIVIIDDFGGKESGIATYCPHISRTIRKSSLISNLNTDGAELNSIDYGRISYPNDIPINYVTTKVAGEIPQHLFSFNLIEIVERKLGCEIPYRDKVQWLKDNIANVNCHIYGYGSCKNNRNFATLKSYLVNTSSWSAGVSSSSSKIAKLTNASSSIAAVKNSIDAKGFCHYLFTTEASDGVTDSGVYTDYVYVEVKLKWDSAYVALYGENTRARESKCNPVLIQKETKTVKRYLPSKECFTTENTRLSYKDVIKAESGEIVSLLPYKIVTTNGTAKLTRDDGGVSNYTDKIFLPSGYKSYNFYSSPIQVSDTDSAVSHTVQLPIIRYWGGKRYHGVGTLASGLDSCQTITTKTDREGIQQYEIYAGLKNVDGQLVLVLRTDIRLPNNSTTPSTYTNRDYTLPNRPLIK